MARHIINLRTDLADYLAETLRHNDLGNLDIWPAGTAGSCVAALTDRQVEYFETLAWDNDGYIDSSGNMWIGGTDYPVEIVHNAR